MKFRMTAKGAFIPEEHEWDVVFVSASGKEVKFTKRNADGGMTLSCDQEGMGVKLISDGSFIFLLDSEFFGLGTIKAVTTAYIPDEDFDGDATFPDLGGIRTELRRSYIINVIEV